jgi:hypothetical protein
LEDFGGARACDHTIQWHPWLLYFDVKLVHLTLKDFGRVAQFRFLAHEAPACCSFLQRDSVHDSRLDTVLISQLTGPSMHQ